MSEGQTTDTVPAEAVAPSSGASNGAKGRGGRKRAGLALILIIIGAACIGIKWWLTSLTHLSTDDAFIESHIHAVAPRVNGTVTRVFVNDNQFVRKGDLLVELDPADYRAKVNSAAASLDMAKNETSGDYAKVEEARAGVVKARAHLDQAGLDLERGEALFLKEVVPKEQLDRLRTSHRVAQSQLKEAEERERRELAILGLSGSGGREARIAQKAAQLDEARLNLSYTRIFAPADGYITKKSAETGNIVQAGQPLMALVPLDSVWVTANYKERQLTHVQPGQKVEFTVDAYPGTTFRGKVDSIMAGTGAAFSLLPPENATGNYVKVVQRIPVKILIEKESDPDHLLRVGMSVVPTIVTGRGILDALWDSLGR